MEIKLFLKSKIVKRIIVLLVLITIGYLGVDYYKNYQQKSEEEKLAQEKQLEIKQNKQNSEIEKLKKEVESLKNEKPQVIIEQVPILQDQQQEPDRPSIIKQWRPRIAYIDCKYVFKGINMGEQSGSGYVWGVDMENGEVILLTNKHITKIAIHYPDGELTGMTATPTSCDIRIPGDSQFATIYNESGVFASFTEEDVAIITIKNPTQYMKSVIWTSGGSFCDKKAGLGEEILVLGYPGIGDRNDITVTDGIISGYEGNYYITSAKVEHGNSGGAAILVKDNCYLGIPSYVDVGSIESLARIFNILELP